MTNIVFVNQGGKNFLFAVPKAVQSAPKRNTTMCLADLYSWATRLTCI